MLKVIGAGFGRTGTTSLKIALETLGFGKCYHFTEMVWARHSARWLAISEGAVPDWDAIFTGFQATTDWPAAAYYAELAAAYPDARVILSVRDAQDWYRSTRDTIYALRRSMPEWAPGIKTIARLTDNVIWQGAFDGRLTDRAHAIARFEAHNAAVRRTIDADRLLVLDVRDGWEPLCRFLEVPVPHGVAFPHANEARRMRIAARALAVAKFLLPAGALILLLYALVRLAG